MKKIQELKDLLQEIKSKGYLIDDDEIIKKNIDTFIRECIEKYNVLNIDYQKVHGEKPFKTDGKDFEEIEATIKNFFERYEVTDKITELINKISWNMVDHYSANNHEKQLLDKAKKNRILRLYSDRVVVKAWITKDKYSTQNSWDISGHWEIVRNLKDFFRYVLRVEMDFTYIKYSMKDNDFTTYNDNGFDVKIYKNGKIEIINSRQDVISMINSILRDYYKNNEHVLVVG